MNELNFFSKGYPSSPLRWTFKSTRAISMALKDKDYEISPTTIRKTVKQIGFGLQQNRKNLVSTQDPDR
jgi:hypothetical protein